MMTQDVAILRGDLDAEWLDRALAARTIAWDIETTGLDWATDSIGTIQISADANIVVVQLARDQRPPAVLSALLADERVTKVFHHAPFDLRFMSHAWQVTPSNVACTKIATKIIEPGRTSGEYSLKPILHRYLGVEIDKGEQASDWARADLSDAQLAYAANDVRHLVALLHALLGEAERRDVLGDLRASFAYLPTRVALDLSGAGDVYAY